MNEWDKYWSEKKGALNVLYDKGAFFYRKYIIPRILNFFLTNNFLDNAILLHTGCGNGLVDKKANNSFRLLSLDISMSALKLNNLSDRRVRGDIFEIPIKNRSVDGVYNLGLMEHFTENEISKILKEFHRVLKLNGKAILFWPCKFSVSVIFLKVAHYIFNNVFKKNIKLHPDEITEIKSYFHAVSICNQSNLKIVNYYFGPRDFFTHVVIVLKKIV